jgi:hypothetical protein
LRLVDVELGGHQARSVGKESGGVTVLERRQVLGGGEGQRPDRLHALALQSQCLPAGDQHAQAPAVAQQRIDQPGDRL